jgi:hypothetical protein
MATRVISNNLSGDFKDAVILPTASLCCWEADRPTPICMGWGHGGRDGRNEEIISLVLLLFYVAKRALI